MDYLIYPRYLLAISLIGALRDCTTYPPAPPVPSHPREGGARLSAFLFLHMCLEGVVQDDDLQTAEGRRLVRLPLGGAGCGAD